MYNDQIRVIAIYHFYVKNLLTLSYFEICNKLLLGQKIRLNKEDYKVMSSIPGIRKEGRKLKIILIFDSSVCCILEL